MTERPILFSGPMVRALLDGRKTQTRRIVKPQPPARVADVYRPFAAEPNNWQGYGPDSLIHWYGRCPYGVRGDRLWVREAWTLHERFTDVARIVYAASQGQSWSEMHRDVPVETAVTRYAPKPFQEGFRPSIHMPRWASRLTLEITDVRVERLQDISEADALAEGIVAFNAEAFTSFNTQDGAFDSEGETAVEAYEYLWDKINGPGSWAANPWVWAVSFRAEPRP